MVSVASGVGPARLVARPRFQHVVHNSDDSQSFIVNQQVKKTHFNLNHFNTIRLKPFVNPLGYSQATQRSWQTHKRVITLCGKYKCCPSCRRWSLHVFPHFSGAPPLALSRACGISKQILHKSSTLWDKALILLNEPHQEFIWIRPRPWLPSFLLS